MYRIASLALLLLACQTHQSEPTRGPLGKDDNVGSCADSCGDMSQSGSCWCDIDCVAIGDCCEDYSLTCDESCPAVEPPPPGFCPNGTLAPTFDANGECVLGYECLASCPTIEPPAPDFCTDGTIVESYDSAGQCIVGYDCVSSPAGAPGTLDETFDGDGTLSIDFSGSGLDDKIAFEPNGDFYLNDVGTAGQPVVRYSAAGTVDPSFVNAPENTNAWVSAIPVDATHLVIWRNFLGGGDLSLYSKTGTVVPSFGGTGRMTPAHDLSDAIHANGSLYTLGINAGKGRIQRVSLSGDVTSLTTSDVFGLFTYTELAVDAQDRVVVGGEDEVTANGRTGTIARLTAAGLPDSTFGVDGKLTIASPLPNTLFVSVSVALSLDGSGHALIHFTTSSSTIGGQSVLVPFSEAGVAGSLVPVTEVSPTSQATLIVAQPDGKVLVAGADEGVGFVRRYLADGSLDTSFGSAGSLTLAQVPDRMNLFADDDRIVLTTFDQTFNAWKLYLTRVWL